MNQKKHSNFEKKIIEECLKIAKTQRREKFSNLKQAKFVYSDYAIRRHFQST